MSEALFSERDIFEGLSPRELTEYILKQSEKISEAERLMRLADDVLHANGTNIDEQLDIYQNETPETISSQGN